MNEPINEVKSNQKGGELRSILVDVELFKTEIVNYQTKIYIEKIEVQDLTEHIEFIIPLSEGLSTGENKTLGCGYINVVDSIFKNEGITYEMIDDMTVKCLSYHLTSFGVEEYEGTGLDPNDVAPEDQITDIVYVEDEV